MARRARSEEIDEATVGAYHVWSRTVRRAWLTGIDPQTGVDCSYRKEIIERRLEALAGIFAIDVLDHSILDNHFHAILRNRPDLVAEWSDDEVARRWLRLKRSEMELNPEPTAEQIAQFLLEPDRVQDARQGLSRLRRIRTSRRCKGGSTIGCQAIRSVRARGGLRRFTWTATATTAWRPKM